jgi:hypothetical protein
MRSVGGDSAVICSKIPTTEPLILDPYAVVFVMMAHVRPEKILKVTGVIRGLHRKKS